MTISHSDTITKLMAALHRVQGQVDGVAKDSANPHFRNRYASLEAVIDAIREPCNEAGLVVMQAPGELADGALHVTTMIAHAESGEWLRSTIHVPVPKNDPQGAGSAQSYGQRYSLMALFCLPAVDDDGNAALQRSVQRQEPRPVSPPAQRQETRPDPNKDGLKAMLAAIDARSTETALDTMTGREDWKAAFDELGEPQKRVVANAVAHKREQLASNARVPA